MNASTRQAGSRDTRDGDDTSVMMPHASLLARLERAPEAADTLHGRDRDSTPSGGLVLPRWLEGVLRIPLQLKLVGANVLLLVAAVATALIVRHRELGTAPVLAVVTVAFLMALLLNTGLVMLAVRPLRVLEKTVDTIWRGDLGARVPVSLFADRNVSRVSRMFNILLDGLVSDRARTRRLATELINAADKERAAISRELHDSAAQSLAALVMQLSVAVQSADRAPREILLQRIESARILATDTLEEVRLLAHTMHPRLLDDLGLVAALKRLARDTTDHMASRAPAADGGSVVVDVVAQEGSDRHLPATVMSVLYRVAQEAVQNARRHASPGRIEIRLNTSTESATLEVTDDGRGFDPALAQNGRTGIGLFTMRERVALLDGELRIRSGPVGGTSVVAMIPLQDTSRAFQSEQLSI